MSGGQQDEPGLALSPDGPGASPEPPSLSHTPDANVATDTLASDMLRKLAGVWVYVNNKWQVNTGVVNKNVFQLSGSDTACPVSQRAQKQARSVYLTWKITLINTNGNTFVDAKMAPVKKGLFMSN